MKIRIGWVPKIIKKASSDDEIRLGLGFRVKVRARVGISVEGHEHETISTDRTAR